MTFVSFAFYSLFVTLLALIMGAGMNRTEVAFLYISILISAVKCLGYATVSMIVLYCTKNVALATLTDTLLIFAGTAPFMLLERIPGIKFMHLEYRIFEGSIKCSGLSLLLGKWSALLCIMREIILVSVLSLLLSFLLFRKKELDF